MSNDKPLAPFKAKPLGDFLIAGNSGMLETNEWGLADLSRAVLGVRVYGSAAISLPRFCQGVCWPMSLICNHGIMLRLVF